MLCSEHCPRKRTDCKPVSNIVADDNSSFVCVGMNTPQHRTVKTDIFRHCFFSEGSDSMFDYDHYDLKSVIAVMSEALLIDELKID